VLASRLHHTSSSSLVFSVALGFTRAADFATLYCSSFPGLKRGRYLATTFTGAPERGLRPTQGGRRCPKTPDFYAVACDKSVCYCGRNYGNRCIDIIVGELVMARSDACHEFGFIHWEDYREIADISGIVAMSLTLTVRGWQNTTTGCG